MHSIAHYSQSESQHFILGENNRSHCPLVTRLHCPFIAAVNTYYFLQAAILWLKIIELWSGLSTVCAALLLSEAGVQGCGTSVLVVELPTKVSVNIHSRHPVFRKGDLGVLLTCYSATKLRFRRTEDYST